MSTGFPSAQPYLSHTPGDSRHRVYDDLSLMGEEVFSNTIVDAAAHSRVVPISPAPFGRKRIFGLRRLLGIYQSIVTIMTCGPSAPSTMGGSPPPDIPVHQRGYDRSLSQSKGPLSRAAGKGKLGKPGHAANRDRDCLSTPNGFDAVFINLHAGVQARVLSSPPGRSNKQSWRASLLAHGDISPQCEFLARLALTQEVLDVPAVRIGYMLDRCAPSKRYQDHPVGLLIKRSLKPSRYMSIAEGSSLHGSITFVTLGFRPPHSPSLNQCPRQLQRLPQPEPQLPPPPQAKTLLKPSSSAAKATPPLIFDNAVPPVPALLDFPVVVHRVGTRDNGEFGCLDNQAITYLHIDPISEMAPPAWQAGRIGTVMVARKDRKDLSPEHYEAVWMYIDYMLDFFGNGGPPPEHLFKKGKV
ncbi:hypothetical protein BO86DRAFT_458359 [Aspergillus japonicus CBS 114.51]|uniref:Uncharacterized protein n=1 Tax=Aspergillus japonicus CBS 114.51 TaxID=1448312 RepID=A0A8T8WSL7_ASPJA|nr:hypothetical protein BO86DRAFT_458359 [Aspergillus japonicus CBS 114.51]RAH78664.1 hypothetical protein BO86DRAFT_458359 [Aspergillus japonicus CBS 114.51]